MLPKNIRIPTYTMQSLVQQLQLLPSCQFNVKKYERNKLPIQTNLHQHQPQLQKIHKLVTILLPTLLILFYCWIQDIQLRKLDFNSMFSHNTNQSVNEMQEYSELYEHQFYKPSQVFREYNCRPHLIIHVFGEKALLCVFILHK